MSALALSELFGTRSEEDAARRQWLSNLRDEVKMAEQSALRTHKAWIESMDDLDYPTQADIALMLMRDEPDDAEIGRRFRLAVRTRVIETARDTEKDRIASRYGEDLDMEERS